MRTPCHCLLLVWLLGAVVGADAASAQDWPDAGVLDEAVAEALEGKQTNLDAPEWTATDPPRATAITVNAAPLGGFFEVLAYVLLVAVLALIVTMILQKTGVLDAGAREMAGEDQAAAEDAATKSERIPDAAVSAAARGDFGEALRLLLGEVLPRFYRGRGAGWPEAWTSRQCLRRVAGAEPARVGLAGLIGAVECHHFGGLPAERADWEQWERRAGELQPAAPAEVTS